MEATLTNENPKHASVACSESANHSAAVWMAETADTGKQSAEVRMVEASHSDLRMAETATVKTAEKARSKMAVTATNKIHAAEQSPAST